MSSKTTTSDGPPAASSSSSARTKSGSHQHHPPRMRNVMISYHRRDRVPRGRDPRDLHPHTIIISPANPVRCRSSHKSSRIEIRSHIPPCACTVYSAAAMKPSSNKTTKLERILLFSTPTHTDNTRQHTVISRRGSDCSALECTMRRHQNTVPIHIRL